MNKLSDEILNRYLDDELEKTELKMVNDQLKVSAEDRKRLKTLQTLDNNLRKMKIDSVSPDFTSGLMKKITKKSRAKNEQRVFIISISSVFVIIALGVLGYVMSLLFSAPPPQSGATTVTQETLTFLENITVPVKNFFTSTNISIIGSVISLGLLISVYFVFDLLKHTKGNLSRQH